MAGAAAAGPAWVVAAQAAGGTGEQQRERQQCKHTCVRRAQCDCLRIEGAGSSTFVAAAMQNTWQWTNTMCWTQGVQVQQSHMTSTNMRSVKSSRCHTAGEVPCEFIQRQCRGHQGPTGWVIPLPALPAGLTRNSTYATHTRQNQCQHTPITA
jgi:hypothetical protein